MTTAPALEPDEYDNTNLRQVDFAVVARRRLTAAGLNPEQLPELPPQKPNLVQFRLEQARNHLDAVIPRRYRHANTDHPEVLAWIDRFLADPLSCPNLLLMGWTGTGKTHNAYAAVRHIALTIAGRGDQPIRWHATTHADFNAATMPKPDDEHVHHLERLSTCDLLIVDDLLADPSAKAWADNNLTRLFDARWRDCRPTIVTTNVEGPDVREQAGDRITSRIAGGAVVIGFEGADLRMTGARS